jgi:predicted acetyltransferase
MEGAMTHQQYSAGISAIPPSTRYELAFLSMLTDLEHGDPHNAGFYAPARHDFATYVQKLLDEEQGLHLVEGWVPCSHRWLVTADNTVVGVCRVRHNIDTVFLADNAGHVGYDIAPSQRGQGYGKFALRTAAQLAQNIGLTRVLIVTAEDNIPSRAILQGQGALLESIAPSDFWGKRLCRYWLDIPPPV